MGHDVYIYRYTNAYNIYVVGKEREREMSFGKFTVYLIIFSNYQFKYNLNGIFIGFLVIALFLHTKRLLTY